MSATRVGSLSRSNKKILPPISGTGQTTMTNHDTMLNTTNNKSTIRLDTLSPVHGRPIKRLLPGTTTHKDPKFFITSEFMTPHYIDEGGSQMEPSMIGKVSPT